MKKGIKIVLFLLPVVLIGGYLVLYCGSKVEPEVDKIQLVYGDHLKEVPDYEASVFGEEAEVEVVNHVDESKLGPQMIDYTVRFGLIPLKSNSVTVEILDLTPPAIELEDGGMVFVKKGETPDYGCVHISDDYDEEPIIVYDESKVNFNREGSYEVKISATDSSGNENHKSVQVIVGKLNSEDFSHAFFLQDVFPDTILAETEYPIGEWQFDQIYFVGDSNMRNMSEYGFLRNDRVIARFALSPSNFDRDELLYRNDTIYKNLYQMIEEHVIYPQYLLLEIGSSDTKAGNVEMFIKQYQKVIDTLKEVAPNTTIILGSIFPIVEDYRDDLPSQRTINIYNYFIGKLAQENDLPLIDAATYYYDGTGHALEEYYREDGYHIKGDYFWIYKDYLKYHLGSIMR
ncbi:MAG: hypothetical protein HUJ56_12510 [Erysipelotrichaceae bacterium]|nr:hypothetical protein [Erysipelotrichaceae bacterium]